MRCVNLCTGDFLGGEKQLCKAETGENRGFCGRLAAVGEMRIHRIAIPGAKDIAAHVCLQLGLRGSSSRGTRD